MLDGLRDQHARFRRAVEAVGGPELLAQHEGLELLELVLIASASNWRRASSNKFRAIWLVCRSCSMSARTASRSGNNGACEIPRAQRL
jgi:hypothetical protein